MGLVETGKEEPAHVLQSILQTNILMHILQRK